MTYCLLTGGAYTAKAAVVEVVNVRMARTDSLLAAVDVGPFKYVSACADVVTDTVTLPAIAASRTVDKLLLVVVPHVPAWVPVVMSSIRRLGEYVLI